MATEAQIAANRRNAELCTGPITEEGKATSSKNAVKHGMCAADLILPGEDPLAYGQLREELLSDLQPDGPLQQILFERIVAAAWRLARAIRVERGMFHGDDETRHAKGTASHLFYCSFQGASIHGDVPNKLSRYENSVERGMHRSIAELRRLQGHVPTREAKLRNETNFVAPEPPPTAT